MAGSSSSAPPASGKRPSFLSPSLSSFADVVSAVSSSLRPASGQTTNTTAPPSLQRQRSGQQQHQQQDERIIELPTSRWQRAAWKSEEFPELGHDQLMDLWPDDEEVRLCVRKAVEEMALNWALDPRLVGGQRSESNRGSAAIISLLSHLSIDAASSQKQDKSQASGALPTGEQPSEDDRGTDLVAGTSEGVKPAKQYERHDLLRAIERQDHETIIAIRNSNFDLLIDSAPGASASAPAQTPLGYAISLGPKWAGTQIVLTGALSKFVNSLPDPEEMAELANAVGGVEGAGAGKRRRMEYDPRTMGRLRKLRGNLKLAVDHSLATSQSGLLASYVQVLLISGGAAFIDDSVSSLRTSIHSLYGTSSSRSGSSTIIPSTHSPTNESRTYVLQFVNEGLKKRERVAAVHDLVENATGDLVLMALWEIVRLTSQEVATLSSSSSTSTDPSLLEDFSSPLPPYFLARDDRITGAFLERLNSLVRLLDSPSCTVKRRGTEWTRARGVAEELEGGSGRVRRLESAERVSVIERALGGSRLGGDRGGD